MFTLETVVSTGYTVIFYYYRCGDQRRRVVLVTERVRPVGAQWPAEPRNKNGEHSNTDCAIPSTWVSSAADLIQSPLMPSQLADLVQGCFGHLLFGCSHSVLAVVDYQNGMWENVH